MRKLLLFLAVCLCAVLPASLFAQNNTITGKITDANGNAVSGVSIVIKQTNRGTVTDAEGKFKLNALPNAVLIISSAGFKSQTIKTDNATGDLQIKLTEDIARLDEVVVTGLSTNANTVATISSKELNGVAPGQTFDAALEGKISGAYINANSGAPGGGISIKLRGVTSVFGNTQPLYVIDGVYADNSATSGGLNAVTAAGPGGSTSTQDNPSSRIADLRAEDVENIEMFKGIRRRGYYYYQKRKTRQDKHYTFAGCWIFKSKKIIRGEKVHCSKCNLPARRLSNLSPDVS
jgi:hypothetical protein